MSDSPLMPVDEIFQSLVRKAQALRASRERLDSQEAALAARASLEANRLAQRMEWRPSEAVVLLSEQTCTACGSISQRFEGFAVLMRNQHTAGERLVAAAGLDQGLPSRRHIIPSHSEACVECLPERNL